MSEWAIRTGWLVATLTIAGLVLLAVWTLRRRSKWSSTATANGVKIEMHDIHLVEDLIVDCLWRAPISMTNQSRKPRPLPVVASRATVAAGKKQYLASVFLESNRAELSPDEVAIIWVETVLPAGVTPRSVALAEVRSCRAPRLWALRTVPRSTDEVLARATV